MNDSIHAERGLDLKGAKDWLLDRLLEGGKVNGLTIEDLVACDIDQGEITPKEVAELLCAVTMWAKEESAHYERREAIRKCQERAADRYLDKHEEVIREQAEQFALEEQA